MAWTTGDWAWSLEHDEPCRLVEVHRLWGHGTVLAWLPGRDATVRLSEEALVRLRRMEARVGEAPSERLNPRAEPQG